MPKAATPAARTAAQKTTRQTHERARWIIDRWEDRPGLRYDQMVAEVRKVFTCGKTAAEQAIKAAHAMLREQSQDEHLGDRLVAKYLSISEEAQRNGAYRDAIRALSELRRHLGLGSPDRVQHSGNLDLEIGSPEDYDDMDEDELRALAKLDVKRTAKAAARVKDE